MSGESVRLKVEVSEEEILISLPGSNFAATYQKAPDRPGLVKKSYWHRDDRDAPITLAEFDVLAEQAANAKARELGWIV